MTVTVTGPYSVAGYTGYTFYKFTGAGSTSWTKPDDLDTCDISVVGGGAGGLTAMASSGLGSGYCNNQNGIIPSVSTTVVVADKGYGSGRAQQAGGQSAFGSYTANGGGIANASAAGAGGSGGGSYGGGDGGTNGGNGVTGTGTRVGGAGQGTTTYTCDGVLRCGGGGAGGLPSSSNYGVGGAGGGGTGAMNGGNAATAGTDDYGGGGGGGSNSTTANPYGNAGGTGIVILRYIPVIKKKKGQPLINPVGVLIV